MVGCRGSDSLVGDAEVDLILVLSLAVTAFHVGQGRQDLHQDQILLLELLADGIGRAGDVRQDAGDALTIIGRQDAEQHVAAKVLVIVHHLFILRYGVNRFAGHLYYRDKNV